jgi:phage shock protein PspC (stress-responsive transcriptional regulator)
VSPLINVWWVLYGLVPLIGFGTAAGFVNNITNADAADIAKRFDDFAVVNLVLALVSIGTTAVYLVMMRQLTSRHMRATSEI